VITEDERRYLEKLPDDKPAVVRPFDPNVTAVADGIAERVRRAAPGRVVRFMGASALGIAGQNDIDMYVLCPFAELDAALTGMQKEFGAPSHRGKDFIKWAFTSEGFDVELYLTDTSPSLIRQMRVFELLQNSKELRREYERIKLGASGQSFREYQRRKYEFYNKILAAE